LANPAISICIPAYNRPGDLALTLGSVAEQGRGDWETVVCEDGSPRRKEIESVVREFAASQPAISVRYFSNERNLGYDRNLRRLLDAATGKYCLFLGDDDLLAPGALGRILDAVSRPGVGFVLRAWKSLDKSTSKEIEEHRYFPEDRIFPPGTDSVAALFRRSVFLSGLAMHRETARRFRTERFDGTLLYQLYLVGRIVSEMTGYYIADFVALRRIGGGHFFGSSETERARFTPGELVPSQSVAFVKGLIDIAKALDAECAPGLYPLVLRDLGRYSYPMLEIQAKSLDRKRFRAYARQLAGLGLGDQRMFWIYYYALLSAGPRLCGSLIRSTKRVLGRTPDLSSRMGSVR
jgi:glycosyltransferase involved in cell wall biosynthesis